MAHPETMLTPQLPVPPAADTTPPAAETVRRLSSAEISPHNRSGADPLGIPGARPLPERAEPATERLSAKTAAALVRRAAVRARHR